MKVLVFVSHPRRDSLSANIAKKFIEGLAEAGHEYKIADYKKKAHLFYISL